MKCVGSVDARAGRFRGAPLRCGFNPRSLFSVSFSLVLRREEEELRREMEEKRNYNLKLKEEAKIAREVRAFGWCRTAPYQCRAWNEWN